MLGFTQPQTAQSNSYKKMCKKTDPIPQYWKYELWMVSTKIVGGRFRITSRQGNKSKQEQGNED